MRRTITIGQPLPAWPHLDERFRDDPGTWLPDPRPNGPGAWLCEVGPTPEEARSSITAPHRRVRCEVGDVWSNSEALHRRITWSPVTEDADLVAADRFLPGLDGHLHLTRKAGSHSLVLSGEVILPLGPVGGALDAVWLRRVADRTLTSFLRAVAERLGPELAELELGDATDHVAGLEQLSQAAARTSAAGNLHRPER